MRGNWGVRFVMPAGNTKLVKNFDVRKVASQISQLKTISWVMINLTGGANGTYYTGPSNLLKGIDDAYAPSRDLFREMATLLKAQHLKVFAYFDSQGPGGEKFFKDLKKRKGKPLNDYIRAKYAKRKLLIRKWKDEIKRNKTTQKDFTARLITEFSRRYGSLIDGWWFDHGETGFPEAYIKAAKSGNKMAVVAWNEKHKKFKIFADGKSHTIWGLARSSPLEDYTAGHITPQWIMPYSNALNFKIVEQIRNNRTIDGLVPHLFFPVQAYWRGGKVIFDSNKLFRWVDDVLRADGAVTVAMGLAPPEFTISSLDKNAFKLVKGLDKQLALKGYKKSVN